MFYMENHIFAKFLEQQRKDYDEAENYYRNSIDIHPDSGVAYTAYGFFLFNIRKDFKMAEAYFRHSIDILIRTMLITMVVTPVFYSPWVNKN